jgi:endonuclease/exonuclease/phosphatase family metal-dependent hydrolase
MSLQEIKILNLNIHNYHGFTKRKEKIISLIEKYDPDIVTLQEVRDNREKNKEGEDQAKQLNEKLNFKHYKFLVTDDVNRAKGLKDKPLCYEGLAVFSKFPFSSEEIKLKKEDNDKYYRKILIANIKIEDQTVPIWVVHFSNSDFFANLHAKETLAYAKSKNPIILGDFNIKYPKEIKRLAEINDYFSSSDFAYISYPKDNCSYDYIFIPKKFKFTKFKCLEEDVSDHKALFAIIKL